MTTMKYLGALGLLLAACGGQANTGPSASTDQVALKKAAAEAVANGSATSDACATNSWYGDKVCDTFCQDKDTDCVAHSATPVVCAEFVQASDGKCSRPADDECRFQDPDCVPSSPPDSGPGTICATYVEQFDGVCSRPANDPCISQDPDCAVSTPPNNDPGTACATYIQLPDGKCSRPADDPCIFQDPDCTSGGGSTGSGGTGGGVACPALLEQSDGKCSRPDSDPCQSIDPDCNATGNDGGAGAGGGDSVPSSGPTPLPPCCKK